MTSIPAPVTQTKRPEDTAFKQQRLPAWQPVMSPPYVIGCFLLLAVIFIPLGAAILVASDSTSQYTLRYDHIQSCPWSARDPSYNYACAPTNLTFVVTKTMKAPVFIYYRLDNFYQNHRRYARSLYDLQLAGQTVTDLNTISDCSPFAAPGQYPSSLPTTPSQEVNERGETVVVQVPANTTILVPEGDGVRAVDITTVTYHPCGLVPWSMFNDSFVLSASTANGTARLVCNGEAFDRAGNPLISNMLCAKRGIAWPSDVNAKYAPLTADARAKSLTAEGWPSALNTSILSPYVQNGWYLGEPGHRIPDPADEDLMVWMRLSALSSFTKLYRRIDADLEPGTYYVSFLQRFDVSGFGGKKYFILTTTSWIGGPNFLLGALYIAAGATCLVLGVAFIAKYMATPKRVGTL